MEVDRKFILEQLEIHAQHFESIGDQASADQVRDLINKANIEKNDDAFLDIELTIKIEKFDGEKKDGDLPVETIVFKNGEKQCL